ncbi:MAG: hypothetical protein ACFE8L_14030 [Candidatus Hodarchaeota archaeon]
MTEGSYSKGFTNLVNYVLEALEGFKGNYTKKFNFSRLIEHLKVPKTEIDDLLYLILNFQEKFNGVFKHHILKKKVQNGSIYLITEKKENSVIPIPENITIRQSDLPILSDIIYLFKFVKRGKGFNINSNGTDLSKNLKKLQQQYPYLFEIKDNDVIYPSDLGLKFGELVLSFSKNNKEITEARIDNHAFKVIYNE